MRRRLITGALAVVVAMLIGATPAHAAVGAALAATTNETDPLNGGTVGFATTSSSTFTDVQASMLEHNDPADVAALLERLASAESPDLEALRLDEYPLEEAQSALNEAATFAQEGERLPGASARVSGSSYPVMGEPISGNWSWEMQDRAEWNECGWFSCEVTSSISFRFVTDPNDVNTSTSFTATKFGDNTLNSFKLGSSVLQDGNWVSGVYGKHWNPGYGTQWNLHPLDPNNGHTFQGEYQIEVPINGGGSIWMTWATGVTSTCGEPVPGAFRCLFL